jgi:hypothetical protein
MKKTKANPKAKNVQTNRLALFVIQRGANAKAKKLHVSEKAFIIFLKLIFDIIEAQPVLVVISFSSSGVLKNMFSK